MYIRRTRLTKVALKPAIFQVGPVEIFLVEVGPKGVSWGGTASIASMLTL